MRKSIIISLTIIAVLSAGAITTYNFYAPLTSGTSGQILVSAGANANPVWLPDTKTRVTLNGESKAGSAIDIYAPTASGTANDILISQGAYNSPIWVSRKSASATMAGSMGGTVTCYRLGQIVFLLFNAVNKYSDAVQQVATIPTGYRPISWMCAAAPDAQNLCGMWNIGPNGTIELYGPYSYTSGSTTYRKNYFGTIMYFTNDAMP